MKEYAPRKVFITVNGEYVEISHDEHIRRRETDPAYAAKKFILVHGMIMEVTAKDYADFYREKRRQKYLDERSAQNGDISYDMLTTDEFNGEDILVDHEQESISDIVVRDMMVDKLHSVLPLLSEDERELIEALFFDGKSEREWSKISGIPQKTINDRKKRILTKLKKLLEN